MKKIAILGCTGSIGDTTFRVLAELEGEFQVVGLSAGRRTEKLLTRAAGCGALRVCVGAAQEEAAARASLPGIDVVSGPEGLVSLATDGEVDLVVNALVGRVGLEPTIAALRAGKVVAMANKEPIVMAGELIMSAAAKHGGALLPLDSEPNAIWQCLKGERKDEISRIILTASGGPFFGWTAEEMGTITLQQALNHPTWTMGPKITVDSATLMNKGFEVIEASWLFDLSIEQVDVVVHRESTVHSMVEFVDGAILAHLGKTDMFLPIQYALTHPSRRRTPLASLNLLELGALHFAAPDRENFPCLDLCFAAGREGGTAPAALNAANEVAVAEFLAGRAGFVDISETNRRVLDGWVSRAADSIETVVEADREAREVARRNLAALSV